MLGIEDELKWLEAGNRIGAKPKQLEGRSVMKRARLSNMGAYDVSGAQLDLRGLSEGQLRKSILRTLGENVLCSIATVTAEGRAHINAAYFCYSSELELYFLSHPASLHCRNLSANPSAGVTVFSSSQTWGGPDRGLQLFGTCCRAKGAPAAKAERLYGERFPEYARWRANLNEDDAAREYHFYRLLTARLKALDEETFGEAVFISADVRRV
jgi:uncharacterized protein YhbP (UPF0306 family)